MSNNRSEAVSQSSPEGQLESVDSQVNAQILNLSEHVASALTDEHFGDGSQTDTNAPIDDEAEGSAVDSELTESYLEFETAFRKNHPALWWSTLLGPVAVTAVVVGLVYLFAGPTYANKLVTMGAMALFFFGRFIILNGLDEQVAAMSHSMTSEQLFFMVSYLDLMLGIVLAFHIGFMFRIPYLGPKVAAFSSDARFILNAQPWVKRATFVGLICFVGFPLSATGAVGGSIFGRLLGLNRLRTFIGILIGATMGNALMLFASDFINQYLNKDNPAVKWGGVAIIVAAILLLNSWYKRLKKRYGRE